MNLYGAIWAKCPNVAYLEGRLKSNKYGSLVHGLTTTLNAWENTWRHDCGLHIAHVLKNPCGSRDFPNQALLFLNCTPISFFAASCCPFSSIIYVDEQWQQQEKVRPGNEATGRIQKEICFFSFVSLIEETKSLSSCNGMA